MVLRVKSPQADARRCWPGNQLQRASEWEDLKIELFSSEDRRPPRICWRDTSAEGRSVTVYLRNSSRLTAARLLSRLEVILSAYKGSPSNKDNTLPLSGFEQTAIILQCSDRLPLCTVLGESKDELNGCCGCGLLTDIIIGVARPNSALLHHSALRSGAF